MNFKNYIFICITGAIIAPYAIAMDQKIPAPKDLYNLGLAELHGCFFRIPPLTETKVSLEDLFNAEDCMNRIEHTRLHRHFVNKMETGISEAKAQENPPLIVIKANHKRKNTNSNDEIISDEHDTIKHRRQTIEPSHESSLSEKPLLDEKNLLDNLHQGEVENIQAMIENGQITDINRQIKGHSLLHHALQSKHQAVDMIQMLAKKGIMVDSYNKKGSTPLHIACRTSAKNVNALLDAYAQVNMGNNQGNYPIHIAVSTGRMAIIECLLNHQNGGLQQLEFKDNLGLTASELARRKYAHDKKRHHIITYLLQAQKQLLNQKESKKTTSAIIVQKITRQHPLLDEQQAQCVHPLDDSHSMGTLYC